MEELALEFVRVVEEAAIESARTMGRGEPDKSDQCAVQAMRRALARLAVVPDHILVDGNALPTLGHAHINVVKGDSKCYAIACASIVAKELRDRLMRDLARRHPGYGWDHNAGYGTAEHMAALSTRGPTPHHRRSFAPVQASVVEPLP